MSNLESRLRSGLEQLSLAATDEQVDLWLRYLHLLDKWNKVTNLTAVRDIDQMLSLHLLDSLSIAPLDPGSLLDLGSGGGLPGIPLAILQPERKITLLDSNIKKTTFMRQAVTELKLDQVDVVHSRVESWQAPQAYRFVVSRAFTAVPRFVELGARFLQPSGALLAMIGKQDSADLSALSDDFVYTVRPLTVPELDAERHLVIISAS